MHGNCLRRCRKCKEWFVVANWEARSVITTDTCPDCAPPVEEHVPDAVDFIESGFEVFADAQ